MTRYSQTPVRMGQQARDRGSLPGFLRLRHEQGDHLTLVSLTKNSGGNFGFVLDRNGTPLPSKGAVDCAAGRFIVFSIGPNPGPGPG
ncbi:MULTISPECIES: hypothetical protein [Amycolatopsis]|uniref:Uncharacterized protein n=2 Tax=Amycolatopsis TaxID=1813 RepID=A0A1I3K6T0_9PSEU|nr:hypothetical protein [Amycolatopsis sacchari]SFI68028.1 hypothetical protein SAMN05421835_101431 [Amycolatopsis sacchari]